MTRENAREESLPMMDVRAETGTATFTRRSHLAASAEEVFRWHARPGALERLTPPWAPVELVERSGGIEAGARVVLRLPVGPISVRWVAEHTDCVEGRMFRDVQVEGPFARWEHTHRFEPDGDGASILEDRIDYALPLGGLGRLAGGGVVSSMLERMFAYRHRVTAGDIATHSRYAGRAALHFLLSGAGGLVGGALVPFLTTGGHRVTPLTRRARGSGPGWDPESGRVDLANTAPLDAVVHLAGENIAGARWTDAVKQRIFASRARGTRVLCEALARLERKPRVLVCASAIGIYGDRGDAILDENAAPGEGFLADVCRAWEEATEPASAAGIRVVHLRLGIVLTAAGGALVKMLPPFRLGLGGRLGAGSQWMSWISLDDVLGAILHASMDDRLEGAVNAVSPAPATNADFTADLAGVLGRPAFLPLPAFAARAALGEMADALLLASTRVEPSRLTASGFLFRQPTLEAALRHTLGKTSGEGA